MRRPVVFAVALLAIVSTAVPPAAGQGSSPLLGAEFNCAEAQAAFGGQPQPAAAGQTTTIAVANDCYLVISVEAESGDVIRFAHVGGDYGLLNIAFYREGAAPGQAFSDPPDVANGSSATSLLVPGDGAQTILVAVQGVGAPAEGSASVSLTPTEPPATTTTTTPTTTAPPTTAASSAVSPTTSSVPTTSTSSTSSTTTVESTTEAEAAASTTIEPSETADDGAELGAGASDEAGPGDESFGLPWWLLGLVVLGALVWLAVMAVRARRPAPPLPWERNVVSWTLQHKAPTGSCSSSARALVDPDDDGTLAGYNVTGLFALPVTGKRARAQIGDPLLAQLEALWATQPTGEELRSAVDAYVNTLCRFLDAKKVSSSATLLTELTKPDVVVHGEVHACVDGGWQMFEGWRDVPDLPAGQVQHDILQVAVLDLVDTGSTSWLDRADDISRAIVALIDTRRAPAGLWVFD